MPLTPGHWSRRQIVRRVGLLDVTLFSVCLFLFPDVSQQTACKVGWFGSVCQYKCRCTNDSCDENGLCLGNARCVGGWFGPACQYVDLAYNQTSLPEITDGNDETCIHAKNMNKVIIMLNKTFTWLRIRGVINDLRLKLRQQGYTNQCRNSRNATVDDLTLDIHCPSNDTVLEVHVYWFEASQLCSIYVSGGRNVALKQNATQSSTYYDSSDGGDNQTTSYPAELAIDGCLDPLFNLGRACARTQPDAPEEGVFNIRLSQPRIVNRFIIAFGFTEFGHFTQGFQLELMNSAGTTVYNYTRDVGSTHMLYRSTFVDVIAALVKITSNGQDKVLNICEFELYGDSSCPHGQFGRECEKTCKCLNKEDCFVSTGGCPSGCSRCYQGEDCSIHMSVPMPCVSCSSGYQGEDCNTPCDVGTHGLNCQSNCSQFCEQQIGDQGVCDPVNGSCIGGCQAGFEAPTCLSACETNMYGIDCKSHCSKGCLLGQDPQTTSCHHATGACVNGCSPGHNGTLCVPKSVISSTVPQNDSRLVIMSAISTLGVVSCLVIVYLLLCVKKDRHLSTEEQPSIKAETS